MIKEKEKMLEKLRNVKQTAESYLAENNFENYVVKNVVRYNKEVELTKKDSENKDVKKFHLYVVELENTDPEIEENNILTELEYLEDEDGNLYTISDLIKEYEGFENIKDVVDKTKENEEKPKEEQDEEFKKDSLEELEEEKSKEEKEEKAKDKKEDKDKGKNIVGNKPKGVIQSIDPHKTYVNSIETVSRAFNISSDVDEMAIADTQEGDENALSDDKTIYMLDKDGKIIEESNGKKINELFEYDDATGKNPMYDDNTKIELDGYAKKNKGQTIARFKSKYDPDLDFSVERKKVGQYNRVYAEQKTRDGNDAVGIELETDNSEIQTDLEEAKINGYSSGDYKKEYIDSEADMHEEHGDDEEKIAIENVDGDELTKVACESPYVPDTNITWEQFSKSVGDKNVDELQQQFFDQYKGENGEELILKIQADYKERENIEQTEEIEIEEQYEGRVPWDSTKH